MSVGAEEVGEIRQRYNLSVSKGAFVVQVSPGTPADMAGLRQYDVITALGPDKVTSSDELGNAVRKHKAGDKVDVKWQRGNSEQTASVTLASRGSGSSG